ncbi:MAG: DUF488 family protein [Snodgrassella sp.]|nr:DUF488 family protein [Snodgrassella sp.]
MYNVQRIFDYHGQQPAILIDRLWPRGISKERLMRVRWFKNIAPSAPLRQWFHQDRDNHFKDFCHRYQLELQQPEQMHELETIRKLHLQQSQLLLLTACKNIAQSHIPVLLVVLHK